MECICKDCGGRQFCRLIENDCGEEAWVCAACRRADAFHDRQLNAEKNGLAFPGQW